MDRAEIVELDRRLLWHPYTQMADFEAMDPLVIVGGKGPFLFDGEGRRYYDTISSWWCNLHGHSHPRINEAISGQLTRLEHVHFAGTTHEPAVRLAERLSRYLPSPLCRFFFSDDGSTAVEVALKMSVQYWHLQGQPERCRFISLERGYHGDTIGTMALGGVPTFEGPFHCLKLPGHRLPAPYCYRCPAQEGPERCGLGCLEPLAPILERHGHEIAAVVVEPLLMGAGGMLIYPPAYLRVLAERARAAGIHLIFDEVATGFGRTGRMFAMEHAGVVPDFLCLSKGLTAGYLPMALTVTTEEIYRAFYGPYSQGRTFFHGHTFTGSLLGCAAANASLDIFEEEGVLEGLAPKVRLLQEGARELLELEPVGDVRGLGMVAAFELVADRVTKEPFPPEARVGWQLYLRGLEEGLILRPLGDVNYLFLPLCCTESQIEDILERVKRTLRGFRPKVG